MLISILNNNKTLALYYIMKTILPCVLTKYPILKAIYHLLDLKHFLNFLAAPTGTGGGPTVFESILKIKKYSDNNMSIMTQRNTLLIKNLLWKEVSSLLVFLFPNTQNPDLIKTKEISRLCQICKNLPTNAINFQCMHVYCYYCYMNYPKNSNIEIPSRCLICN